MKKPITINGVDCSTLFMRYGYRVSYKKIQGSAGGIMLDGSTTEDVIAIKAVITLSFFPQTESGLATFITSLYSTDYAMVTYFDPRTGSERTIETMYSEITTQHSMTNINDDEMWILETLTLTER